MTDLNGEKRRSAPQAHFSITLPHNVKQQLDEIAARRGSKRGAVVREAVLDWLARFNQRKAS